VKRKIRLKPPRTRAVNVEAVATALGAEEMFCEHANEKPVVCPCEATCVCKLRGGCLPGKRKSMRDDPEVQQMTRWLKAGRDSERMDVMEELKGRIDGSRGWWAREMGTEARKHLEDLYRWLEARDARST
jgi:hypothetical protein